jgi:ABC-type uncharacterized transport system ATPase subunit
MRRMAPPLLRLQGIGKRFGSLVANEDITLDVAAGEVLALLGENGAGKSTLVSILFGHYVADAGTIEVDGVPLAPGDTAAALAAGIGMVHQHFTLADNLSVLDNVMLGTEPLWHPWSRRGAARAHLLATARRFGLAVQPDALVGTLSVGERQQVEIVKALVRGARALILDEPTAVLTPQQSASLFATLRQLVDGGLAVIFISHKLDEVLAVAQRIAVLRAGRLVALRPAAGASKQDLAEAMVGHAIAMPQGRREAARGGAPVGELDGVSVAGPGKPLREASLQLHAGEIVGVAGVSGNGQQTLVDLLCGLVAADAGRVTIDGRALPATPRAWVDAGVARVPQDRQAVGAIGDLALWENALLERYATPAYATRAGWLRRSRALADTRALLERFDVRGGDVSTPARRLSGGNLQKLVLGRALGHALPKVIVAHQPTWGLDVGAVAEVHRRLLDAAAQGAAVLLVSEDLDELFALADRLAVMHQGRLTRARPVGEWTLAQVGLAMSGQQPAEPVMAA